MAAAHGAIVYRDSKVEHARVVLGGVAPIPWRSREAEASLARKASMAASAAAAADKALESAGPLQDNAYKVDLSCAIICDALRQLA